MLPHPRCYARAFPAPCAASSHWSDALAKSIPGTNFANETLRAGLELFDQCFDSHDAAKIRRGHVAIGNLHIELGLDREHQIDHVERRDAALTELVVAAGAAHNRPLFQDRTHERGDPLSGGSGAIRSDTIQHGERFPNSNQKSRAFAQPILHFRRDKSLSLEAFSIGNLYAKEAR